MSSKKLEEIVMQLISELDRDYAEYKILRKKFNKSDDKQIEMVYNIKKEAYNKVLKEFNKRK